MNASPQTRLASLKAIAAMVAGTALLLGNDAALKYLTKSYPAGQVIFLRQMAMLLVIVPYITIVTGWGVARVTLWRGQVVRGLLLLASFAFTVVGLSFLPLTTVTAITFLSPIFVVLLSAPLLGERVGPRRWIAALIGFIGMLLIVRPGTIAFEWVLLLPMATALTTGLREVLTRHLSRSETSIAILLSSTVIVMLGGLTTAPFGWSKLDLAGAGLFLLAGVCNTGAQFLMIEALRMGEASLVSPFRYTGLVWAILFGYLLWGEVPGLWVAFGVSLIVFGGWYTVRGESSHHAPSNR